MNISIGKMEHMMGINPFQLFEFIKHILNNPEIKRKELHETEYFPTRYLCELVVITDVLTRKHKSTDINHAALFHDLLSYERIFLNIFNLLHDCRC
jgi:hypothetical protein